MSRQEANKEELEASIRILRERGKKISFNSLQKLLHAKNLTITKTKYYDYLYREHLYDWKTKASPNEVKEILKAEERIDELEKTLSQIRATLESTADGILMINRAGQLVNWNQKFMEMFRFPAAVLADHDETKGLQYFLDQVVDPQELFNLITRCYDDPNLKGDMGDMYFKDGRVFERYSQPHLAGDQIIGRVWSFRDVTERRKKDEELRLRERAIEASNHCVVITDNTSDYKIIYVNPAFLKMTQKTRLETICNSFFFWIHDENQHPAIKKIRFTLREKCEDQITLFNYREDGSIYWVEINIAPVKNEAEKVTHFVWIVNDISQRKIMEDKLAHQATHDALTGLANRSLLQDRLQQAILHTKRLNLSVAILFIDLDRFKFVNDALGHSMGDEVLKIVGNHLLQCVRAIDTVARLGGDEFVIVSLVHNHTETMNLARRILQTLIQPIEVEGRILNITGSIGISLYPDNGDNIEVLLKNADIAMYRAKESGRDNAQFYSAKMNKEISRRLELENDLHKAIARNEFILYFQPIMSRCGKQITGVEALLRWQHPKKGLISPNEFIPIAEDSGLILLIGEWVLETACTQYATLQSYSDTPIHLAINVASRQLERGHFVDIVNKILHKTQIPPQYLELELTERIFIEDTNEVLKILNQLKSKQIKLTIDDFGTGYSNLGYLKTFPLDKLKIDKSFIDGIDSGDPNDAAITQTIIAMAHILGLTVVAEGVETKNQVQFLQNYLCDEMQGFYFNRPLPEKDMISLLKSKRKKIHRGE